MGWNERIMETISDVLLKNIYTLLWSPGVHCCWIPYRQCREFCISVLWNDKWYWRISLLNPTQKLPYLTVPLHSLTFLLLNTLTYLRSISFLSSRSCAGLWASRSEHQGIKFSSLDTYCAASSMFFLVAISFRPPRWGLVKYSATDLLGNSASQT